MIKDKNTKTEREGRKIEKGVKRRGKKSDGVLIE